MKCYSVHVDGRDAVRIFPRHDGRARKKDARVGGTQVGEAVTQDRPAVQQATGAAGGTQERATGAGGASGGGGAGATAVHPGDEAIAKKEEEKKAWMKDMYQKTGPLDDMRPKGPYMSDPDGHCIKCGNPVEADATMCLSCGSTPAEFDKEITDFWFENKDKSPTEIHDAWTNGKWHQDKLRTKGETKSQVHGL